MLAQNKPTKTINEYTIEVSAEASKLFYIKASVDAVIEQVKEQAITKAKEECDHLYLEDVDFEADVWEDRYECGEFPVEVTVKVCREFEVKSDSNDKAETKAIALLEDEFTLYDWENYMVDGEINFINGEIPFD